MKRIVDYRNIFTIKYLVDNGITPHEIREILEKEFKIDEIIEDANFVFELKRR